ncbi:hypothetical protein NCAST_32_09300 [Nocardia asteroides NBRC 15531]|uniref:Uncharacterized protein n=1 Tax=Nocardia asteroides NBRC 15531 TaxID=1110697 RepID=U5EMX2_NOCAS|nr:hypothetical protein NCAST_32_09300 [Nocardia asteroides NBRC 15531]
MCHHEFHAGHSQQGETDETLREEETAMKTFAPLRQSHKTYRRAGSAHSEIVAGPDAMARLRHAH